MASQPEIILTVQHAHPTEDQLKELRAALRPRNCGNCAHWGRLQGRPAGHRIHALHECWAVAGFTNPSEAYEAVERHEVGHAGKPDALVFASTDGSETPSLLTSEKFSCALWAQRQ